ncbi:MAG: hypothetical protein LUF33_00310 [Clostridiales bacterium]|nr:hypothetical protein [Clostridiales bacterium]
MNLIVKGNFSGELINVTVNGATKSMDADLEKSVSFDLPEGNTYKVVISTQPDKNNRTLLNILLFVVTMVIRGIFCIFLPDTDSKWYKNISPYCLRAEFTVNLKQDTEIAFKYKNAEYNEISNTWFPAVFECNMDDSVKVSYTKNTSAFKNQWFNYVKKAVFGKLCFVGIVWSRRLFCI